MTKNALILTFAAVLLVLAGVAGWHWFRQEQIRRIDSFEECADAGYPVMESYPRRCGTPDGRTFTEEVPDND